MIEKKQIKKHLFLLVISFAMLYCTSLSAQSSQVANDSLYLFCYFKNNGEDGLHLAFSNDGYKWKALFNDSSVLKPAARMSAHASSMHY